jgi:hypothetical protein
MSYIFKSKIARKIFQQILLFPGFSIKTSLKWDFDDKMGVIHDFILQIFRAAEQELLVAPPPPQCGSFQPESVSLVMALKLSRIRVQGTI